VIVRRRRLPHFDAVRQPQFITFRLQGSLPPHRVFPASSLTFGQAFVAMDRLLDHSRCGPAFLRSPEIVRTVLESIEYGVALGHYQLHSWVIMPNHVHLLLTPEVSLSRLLGSMKAATARRANALLKRTGRAFWQDESYDHLVRSRDEFQRIWRYVENNPVAAGLAARPEDYKWSSAGRPEGPPQAEGLPHIEIE
jgi:REP element-mobilizing transposase RayT